MREERERERERERESEREREREREILKTRCRSEQNEYIFSTHP